MVIGCVESMVVRMAQILSSRDSEDGEYIFKGAACMVLVEMYIISRELIRIERRKITSCVSGGKNSNIRIICKSDFLWENHFLCYEMHIYNM